MTFEIRANQYYPGFVKTYYYAINEEGKILHTDLKLRNKSLKQLRTHGFDTKEEVNNLINRYLVNSGKTTNPKSNGKD